MDDHRDPTAQGGGLDGVAPAPNLRRRRTTWAGFSPTTWNPAPSSIAPNSGYREPGTPGGRGFAPTEHLAPEAVAAFVDGELGMTAHLRATHHLNLCPECAGAVDAQASARARLRESGRIAIPASLLGQLAQIPTREIDMTDADAPTGRLRGGEAGPLGRGPRGRLTRRWGR